MQLELPKRLNSILPILKWNLTFYFRLLTKLKIHIDKPLFDYIMEAYTWTVTLLRLNLNTKTCFGYATRGFFIGY